jgi:hypothetical protein
MSGMAEERTIKRGKELKEKKYIEILADECR